LQLEYSLAERNIEREHVPAALELGLGIAAWSPLASGLLAGKYERDENGTTTKGGGRLDRPRNPAFPRFTERNWKTLDGLRKVAAQLERSPAQVALAWALARPGITSLILGATKLEQLHDNLASLEVELSAELSAELDQASALDLGHPCNMFSVEFNRGLFGEADVKGWRAQ
jgi:aryl-alcohol dehydrogenase-like predicted oxidoreductase